MPVAVASLMALSVQGMPDRAIGAEGPEGSVSSRARPIPARTAVEARKEAAEIYRDLRELAEAIQRDNARITGQSPEKVLAVLGRPERTVETPTLDPAAIDALINTALGDDPRAGPTTDEEFLRRACLDLSGSPPTPEQVRQFTASDDPRKRARLIDRLLDSPEFGTHAARYWRDVIRFHATNQIFQRAGAAALSNLEQWLAEQFNANTPWDEIATRSDHRDRR